VIETQPGALDVEAGATAVRTPGRPALARGDLAQTLGPPAVLVVLVVVFGLASPQFRSMNNLHSMLDAAAVLAVVTVGITFVLLLGCIDLSATGVMAACSLTTSLLVANTRNTLDLGVLGVVVAVLLGGVFGLLNGVISVRLKVPSFMATLGVSAIGIGVATVMFAGVQPGLVDPWVSGWATQRWFGFTQLAYLALGCIIIGWFVQRHTRLGRTAMAIGGAEDVLILSGVRVGPYKVAAFTVAGCCYGLAAAMATSQLGAGLVQAGGGYTFASITAAIVGGTLLSGGRGGVLHSMVGVLIVSVLANGLVLIGVSPYIQRGFQGLIVVIAVGGAAWPLRRRLVVVK